MAVGDSIYRYAYQYCEHLKVIHKDLTLDKFLANAGVGEGFGRKLFAKVYDSVMAESENMEDLYERYYKLEYDSFKDFIGAKFAIPKKSLELLMNGLDESEEYTLIRYDSIDYGVTGVDDFINGDDYGERFERLFLLAL